jgi:TPR repeat protein
MSHSPAQLKNAQAGDPVGQCCLGWDYDNGIGVRKSFRRATYWYRRAAKQGNCIAQYNLSLAYLKGEGVKKSMVSSFRWNLEAAKAGYTDAELAAAWFYHNGKGIRQDLSKARTWYLKAARKGNTSAMFSLGQIAFDKKDFKEAVRWFSKAARKDHPRSNYYLGRMLVHGWGVRTDPFRAQRCLKTATGLGVAYAKRLLRSQKLKRDLVRENKVAVNHWRQGALLPAI